MLIADLKDILASARRLDAIVGSELAKIRDEHGDARRTEIVDAVDEITAEALIADEDVVLSISHTGYIKRTSLTTYRSQRRGGRGRVGMKTRDEDFVDQLFIASTHSYVLIFTDRGRAYWLKVHEIPDVGPNGKGKAAVNLVRLQPGEKIAAFLAARSFEGGGYVLLATRKGIVKKTELAAFANPRPSGIIALSVEDDDALIEAVLTTGADQILLATREGMAIHFSEEDVRPMGRAAYGVKGIELESGDEVVALEVVAEGTVLTVDRQRLRQEDRPGRVPPADPGRQGPHQHQDRGTQRIGGGREAPASRGGSDAHHRKRYDHPPRHVGNLDHRPQHSGRAHDPARGRRPPGVGGPPRRAGRRRGAGPARERVTGGA